jgi:hypothetical protein
MLEVEQFEKENPNLETVETMGFNEESIIISRNPIDGNYYAKGPFGSGKKVYYISLGNDLSTESKQTLLSDWRRRNHGS